MKRALMALVVTCLVVAAGCSAGAPNAVAPKATAPNTQVDLGRVPVVTDMTKPKLAQFTIANEGNGPLKLSDVKVKLIAGC